MKTKFLQIYANLPFTQRKEIIVVIDNEPFTWNAAKIEIENDTKKFTIGYIPLKASKPLNDPIAKLFIEPSNLVPISLLKRNTAENAYRKSQKAMLRNFRFMLSTRASQNQKDPDPYLWTNRKYQVLLGDSNAHC